MAYKPTDPVTSEAEIRAVIDGVHIAQQHKVIDHIDRHGAAWIAHSSFLVMSTVDAHGRVDASPKGDPAGFVKVVDAQTLAIPDRPGNHLFMGFRNILETGRIGLVFFVPNRNEVLRVNGAAQVVRDAELRADMAIQGRVPEFAIVVQVEEAFFHCGKAVLRSGLWRPETFGPVDALPTYAQAIHDHGNLVALDVPLEAVEKRLKHNEEKRLYDE